MESKFQISLASISNQKCFISYNEELTHFFLDTDLDITLNDRKEPMTEKISSPLIEESTYYLNSDKPSWRAIQTWKVFVPRVVFDDYCYDYDGIMMFLTSDGIPYCISFRFTSDMPPSLKVNVTQEKAIDIASSLLEKLFRTIRPEFFEKIEKMPDFYLSSTNLLIKNSHRMFHPLSMNFLSGNKFETRLVWSVIFKAKEHTFFPDKKNAILLEKDFEICFYLDPESGEWVGWDSTL